MKNDVKTYHITCIMAGLVVLLTVMAFAPFIGPTKLLFSDVFNWSHIQSGTAQTVIFFQIRLPRVILACLAGAVLAMSGVVLQALLKNPLATPFTIGISGGASLGAVLAVRFGGSFVLGAYSIVSFSAFLGAMSVMGIMVLIAKRRHQLSTTTILLAGVTINFFVSSFITLLNFFSDFLSTRRIVIWLMGGIDVVSYGQILGILPFLAIGSFIIFRHAKSLNILSLGTEMASGLGLNAERVQWLLLFASSLVIASVVSLTGPIGFVGLIVPHIMRMMFGADHRLLLWISAIGGAILLVVCDTLARTVIAPIEIPVGCITTMLGGPFFIWLLKKKMSEDGQF